MASEGGTRVGSAVRGMPPGYFALVMATGIISVGMHLIGVRTLSVALLVVCATAYLVLILLTGWRFLAYRVAFLEDLRDPHRGFQFFTFVAGTNVLAARLAIEGWFAAAATLLGVRHWRSSVRRTAWKWSTPQSPRTISALDYREDRDGGQPA